MSWDAALFRRHLLTRRFGREFVWLEEVDSTNRWLLDNQQRFSMSGAVVAADHQTRGRGRLTRTWFDERGKSLLFSLLLRVPQTCQGSELMTLAAGVALCGALERHVGGPHVLGMKWPNDVQLNGRKLAGILGQTALQQGMRTMVVGVGVNVATERSEFPAEIRDRATSLVAETGQPVTREALLAEVLGEWEPLFDLFLEGRGEEIVRRWEHFGPAVGTLLAVQEGGQTFRGWYAGLGADGQLRLRVESGAIREFFSGDVET